MMKIKEIVKAHERESLVQYKRREILVHWTFPPTYWCKLNTDGAVKNNPGRAGCGGVLRGSCGSWIARFGANLGIATVNEAELWELYHDLEMAWNMGYRRIIVEMDS